MSIRIKLILTYAILVLISATVLIFSGIAILTGVVTETSEAIFEENDFQIIITDVIDLLAELKQSEDFNPEDLINPFRIQELTEKTHFFNGGIVVKFGDMIIDYSQLPKTTEFYAQLVTTGHTKAEHEDDIEEHANLVKHLEQEFFYIDYTFEVDHELVTYYFVIDVTKTKFIGTQSGKKFLTTLLFILFLIMTPLLLIITKDIIKPVRQLANGVKHIKEGDLSFKLVTKNNNELGKVIKYFDVMRVELKKSIEKQIAFEDNRKELISSISHDLKTPITSIKGHVEGIRDGVANTPEKLDKYLNVIYQKSRDMDQLIDDLFLFSKLDLNTVPFDLEDCLFVPFVKEIVQEMQLGWVNENQKITVQVNGVDEEHLTVWMDHQKMKRVFVNVIQNAMKYMDKEEKNIGIHLTESKDTVQCVFVDNGQGIPEEHLEHIFNRFYRVDESRNPETGGTGLGLAISKQIVEQHGGTISATSVLGEGTKIIIQLKKKSAQLDGDVYE